MMITVKLFKATRKATAPKFLPPLLDVYEGEDSAWRTETELHVFSKAKILRFYDLELMLTRIA